MSIFTTFYLSLQNLGKAKDILTLFNQIKDAPDDLSMLDGALDAIRELSDGLSLDNAIDSFKKLGVSGSDLEGVLKKCGFKTDEISEKLKTVGTVSKSNVGFISKLKTAYSGLAASIGISTKALTAFIGTAAAIGVALLVLDALIVEPAEALEKMNKSFEEFEEAQQKVSDLNSELETTRDRINELEAKGGLTFVEQNELKKLRESIRLLEIQADLAEKEAAKEGKEAAEDAVESYNKNFAKISRDKTDQYSQGLRNGEYTVEDLSMNESSISANIAALKHYKKALENIEDEDFFQEINERATELEDTIWEQVDLLAEHQSVLEAIPESYRTKDQQRALDEIKDSIEYIYQELDPAAWKQIKLDELLNNSTFSEAKQELLDMAKASDNVGVSASDVESYFLLSQALKSAGITAQEFADIINSEAGIIDYDVVSDQIKDAFSVSDKMAALTGSERSTIQKEFNSWLDGLSDDKLSIAYEIYCSTDTATWQLEDWQKAVEEASAKVSTKLKAEFEDFAAYQENVTNALESSRSATGLTSEEISNLTSAYKDLESFDAEKLFEETANGIHLNKEELEKLNAELESNTIQKYADEIERLQGEIYLARSNGEDTSELESELEKTEQLKLQYEGLTSAYNDWLAAKSGSNERDSYEDVGAGYEDMKEILDQGWYGDESLNAYLDLLLSADKRTGDAQKDFEQLDKTISGTSHSIMDYWQYDDDDNLVTDGLFDFLDDVNKKFGDTYASISEDGEYSFDFTGEKLQEVADAFGMSTEMVEMFERAMIDAGMAVDMGDLSFVEQISEATENLKELQDAGKLSESLSLDFDVDLDPLEDVKTSIDDLKEERLKIDGKTDPELAEQLNDLIAKCEQQYYFRLNAETEGSLDTAISIVQEMKSLSDRTLRFRAKVENDKKISELATQLASLPAEVQTSVGIKDENLGDVTKIINQLRSAPDSIDVPVNYTTGDQSTPETQETSVNYTLGEQAEPLDLEVRVNYELGFQEKPKNLSATIDYQVRYNGTASNADGTAITAHADGHNWSLPKDENALVNELGTESMVRNGIWRLISGGAHIEKFKKGDIIFSAKQTDELIRSGKVTSGGGHGKIALANGTASGVSKLNAYDTGSKGKRRSGSTSSKSSSTSSSSSDSDLEVFDWIEVAIDRIERAIENLTTTAKSAYKSLTTKSSATADAITKTNDEIALQQKAYDRYMEEANNVGLDPELAALVQNGTIDIAQYDEETQDLINSYTEWYEKALDCSDSLQTLHESLGTLYEDNFNNIKDDFDNKLELLEHMTNTYENGIDMLEAQGYLQSTTYYAAMQDVERQNIAVLNEELASLEKSFSEAMASGEIEEGSESWFAMQISINETKEAIDEANLSLAETAKTMREIEWDHFDYTQDRISQVTQEADFMIDLMSNSDMYDDKGQLTDNGMATMGLHGLNYNTYMAQADAYAQEILEINKQLAEDPYNTDLIERREELLELQQDSILAAEDEKQAIIDMVREGIELELESLKELIDTYTDALDSAKD